MSKLTSQRFVNLTRADWKVRAVLHEGFRVAGRALQNNRAAVPQVTEWHPAQRFAAVRHLMRH